MKNYRFQLLLRPVLAVVLLASLPACRVVRKSVPEGDLRALTEHRVSAQVSQDGAALGLRFKISGSDLYAEAHPRPIHGGSRGVLEFTPQAKQEYHSLTKSGKSVRVLSAAVWQNLSRQLAGDLAPASAQQGVLLVAGDREMIALRDETGRAAMIPLAERPRGVRIIRRLNAAALIPRLLEKVRQLKGWEGSGPLLIATGKTPAFLFVEPEAQRVSVLYTPPAQAAGLTLSPAAAGQLRGLLSLTVRSGVISALKNPLTSLLHGSSNLLTMGDAALHRLFVKLPDGPPPPLANRPPMDAAAWERELDAITSEPLTKASLRFQINGDTFFPAFIQALQDARSNIDIQLYIWDTDDYSLRMADLVKRRAREGVRTRIMIDEIASLQAAADEPAGGNASSFSLPLSIPEYLRAQAPVKVRPRGLNGLTSNHTKSIVIDNERAWLGGMNIGREYRSDWHDMMVEVRGPLVHRMQRDFNEEWAHAGWAGDFAAFLAKYRNPAPAVQPSVPADAIDVRPIHGNALNHDLVQSQIMAIRRAQQSIWLQNAYLSDHRMITELVAARYRGVDVRIILPEHNDIPIMAACNRSLIPALLSHGVRVYLMPGMSHVKAAIYDGWACLGSGNFDRLSLRVNNEFNIGFSDPATVQRLRRELFLPDFTACHELLRAPDSSWSDQLTDSLMEGLAGQL